MPVAFIDRSCYNITTQKQQQHNRVGATDISIAYFIFSFVSVILLALLYDNVSYNFFIYNYY